MKSAEEIAIGWGIVMCPAYPDNCGRALGCFCKRTTDMIRAAQIDAAEWMREEAVKGALDWVLKNTNPAKNGPSTQGLENAIRSIKLPGETI